MAESRLQLLVRGDHVANATISIFWQLASGVCRLACFSDLVRCLAFQPEPGV
jgi:hypothetical protein